MTNQRNQETGNRPVPSELSAVIPHEKLVGESDQTAEQRAEEANIELIESLFQISLPDLAEFTKLIEQVIERVENSIRILNAMDQSDRATNRLRTIFLNKITKRHSQLLRYLNVGNYALAFTAARELYSAAEIVERKERTDLVEIIASVNQVGATIKGAKGSKKSE